MKITDKELQKIKKDKLFKTKFSGKEYWVKGISYKKYKNYKQGNVQAHLKYFKLMKKYLKGHLPKMILKNLVIDKEKFLVIYVQDIQGKRLSERDFKKMLNLSINKKFKLGMKKILDAGYTLDFYARATNNFKTDKKGKIYYIDTRMPLFTKKSNEGNRFDISKKKTLMFLK